MKPLSTHPLHALLAAGLYLAGALQGLAGDPCADPKARDYAKAAPYADMARVVYADGGGTPPPGWRTVAASEHNGDHGLEWATYLNPKTGEVVLSFRGTDRGEDWVSNIANGLGSDLFAPQYRDSLRLAAELKGIVGDRLTVVGHSLGGGLAANAAHRLNLRAYTFNPASVSLTRLAGNEIATLGRANSGRIQNYMHKDDPLRKYLDKVDFATRLGEDTIFDNDDYATDGTIDAHSIDKLAAHLNTFADCFKPKPKPPEEEPDGDGDGEGDDGGDDGGTGGTGLPPPDGIGGSNQVKRPPSLLPFR